MKRNELTPVIRFLRKDHMMGRRFVGLLPGGRPQVAEPSLPFHFDVGTHAPGRLNAERKKLLHLACVKAWGKLGDNPTLTYSGAVYQDFKGTRRYQRCHRSLFEPIVNGSALPDIPAFALQPRLRTILLAPGAVTDPEPPRGTMATGCWKSLHQGRSPS